MGGDGTDIWSLVFGPLGLLVSVVLAILAALKEPAIWVPGWVYRRDLERCRAESAKTISEWQARAERWERLALSTTSLAEKVVDKMPDLRSGER